MFLRFPTQSAMRWIAAIVLMTLPMLACMSGMQTPQQALDEQLRAFHGHLRWGRINEASTFVAPEHQQAFLGEFEVYGDDYQVTEFEVEGLSMERASDTALVTVWMQWFRLPSTRVQEAYFEETWSYDNDARIWQLTSRRVLD